MKSFAETTPYDFLGKEEPLHEDLQPYLEEIPGVGQALRHPLVYSVPHHPMMNAMVNQMYRHKQERLDEVIKSRQWGAVLSLYEKPYRMDALQDMREFMTGEEYYSLLRSVYMGVENIFPYQEDLSDFFNAEEFPVEDKQHVMTEEERQALATLPDVLTIYRGGSERSKMGWSWTLNKEKAKWFAQRFHRRGLVMTAQVPKDRVEAYFLSRGEEEIVVNPSVVQIIGEEYTTR